MLALNDLTVLPSNACTGVEPCNDLLAMDGWGGLINDVHVDLYTPICCGKGWDVVERDHKARSDSDSLERSKATTKEFTSQSNSTSITKTGTACRVTPPI